MLLGLALAASLLSCAGMARADEGMWTLNNFPRQLLKDRYGFDPTQAWLDHLRLSSVKFGAGGSGAFVSQNGLVMTNHHVGADCIGKLSRADRDYYKLGFYAKTAADELKCPDVELDVLDGIEEVTAEVRATERPGASDAEATTARKEKIAAIEKRCADPQKTPGTRCDVVTLYRGARYDLYKYRRYTDVRLVFAPEQEIAFFGGDAANFTYPRYDLDVAFFRAYERDQPVQSAQFLRFSPSGPREGELVFTSGHPGSTQRLATRSMLETLRDVVYPTALADYARVHALLIEFAARGPEQQRVAQPTLFRVENVQKALTGYLDGLKDPSVMARKIEQEARLKQAVAGRPGLAAAKAAWPSIDRAEELARKDYARYLLLEGSPRSTLSNLNSYNSRLFGIARTLVRLVDEQALPSEKRLKEYGDAARATLELALYSAAPIERELEEALLAGALERTAKRLGASDPTVQLALAGKTPAARAKELVRGTKLADVAVRRALGASRKAQDEAKDPLIVLARALDAEGRALRKRHDEEVEGVEERALGAIARAQVEIDGPGTPPDATGTLRISFGRVAGYKEGERGIPPMTVYVGMFGKSQKANNQPPWHLPERWLAAKPKLKPTTPINLVSTNDIIGGNSGSPLVNGAGEVVGLIFDGNIQSLANNFLYRSEQDRAVSVHSVGLLDAIRKVYDAGALVDELTQAGNSSGQR